MPHADLSTAVHGIIVPLITPLAEDERLDHAALDRVVEHVISGGVSGLFILGTTGEGPSLDYETRREVVEAVCARAAGRVPVLVGVTDTAYAQSARLARVAAATGAAAVVIAPPCYFRISQSDLLQYLRRFVRESELPVFLYNIPSLTKTAFELETVRCAATLPGVAGLKDSSGDLAYLAGVVRSAGPRFPVLMGPEEMLVDAMRAGAAGGVCGGANLNPRLLSDLHRAASRGEWETAERLQARVRQVSDALYTVGDRNTSYLRGMKWAMSAAGLCSSRCAPPFAPFTEDEQETLKARFEALELTV